MKSIELFAGAGGLALGCEKAGFETIALNEFNKDACNTLRKNRPNWHVIEGDIKNIDWSSYKNQIDLLTGGFPCQAFSHSGKRLGFEDTRGTLFYEFARTIDEIKPTVFLAENVKGLITHDKGNTLQVILNTFSELGYHVFAPILLNANYYEVAQKRERLFIFGVKKEYESLFSPLAPPACKPIVLKEVFHQGKYYSTDVNNIASVAYSEKKKALFDMIPQGGNWKNLPLDLQKEYLGKMFDMGGGKTGILKRLSMNEASVTILTSPAQKQTERCHPLESRPLNVRESARIQSFPDEWQFCGSISAQYKQIGNAVPVNLGFHVAQNIYKQLLNYKRKNFD
jgi:DNA (cytosine-5)-methyltransferase 1